MTQVVVAVVAVYEEAVVVVLAYEVVLLSQPGTSKQHSVLR